MICSRVTPHFSHQYAISCSFAVLMRSGSTPALVGSSDMVPPKGFSRQPPAVSGQRPNFVLILLIPAYYGLPALEVVDRADEVSVRALECAGHRTSVAERRDVLRVLARATGNDNDQVLRLREHAHRRVERGVG